MERTEFSLALELRLQARASVPEGRLGRLPTCVRVAFSY